MALQQAFVLHTRPFRETSMLVDIFTMHQGRISLIARGARRPRSRTRAYLQLFVPILIDWVGRSTLKTLTHIENEYPPYQLVGNALLSGFYLNELLSKTLKPHDPHPVLFTLYARTLLRLQTKTQLSVSLRIFEKRLLTELGYALPLQTDAYSGAPICFKSHYRYQPQQGFIPVHQSSKQGSDWIFSGASLLALAQEQFIDSTSLRDAKRLLGLALRILLGEKSLKSPEMLI